MQTFILMAGTAMAAASAWLNKDIIGLAAVALFFGAVLLLDRRKPPAERKFSFHAWKALPIFWAARCNTQVGIKTMDTVARRGGVLVDVFGWLAAVTVIPGMLFMLVFMLKTGYDVLTGPGGQSGVALVLPVSGVKGVFYIPFEYWLIGIVAVLTVHEFAHGLMCRRYGIRVKHTGIFIAAPLLPIIPGGFVYPHEEDLAKASFMQKLGMFGAGVFINGLCAFAFLGIHNWAVQPWLGTMQQHAGAQVQVAKNGPAAQAGLKDDDVITAVDGLAVTTPQELSAAIAARKPGDVMQVTTLAGANVGVTLAQHPQDASKPLMGIASGPYITPREGYEAGSGKAVLGFGRWLTGLVFILFLLNIGIGLMNLFPAAGTDGFQALHATCQKLFGPERGTVIGMNIGLGLMLLLLGMVILNFFK